MRTWLFVLVLAGCHSPSKLDAVAGADCDVLWDLAPSGTEVGIVASPRGLGLVLDAFGAATELAKTPDFAGLAPELDAVTAALFGAPGAHPIDAGIEPTQGFALFVTAGGVLGVLPVGDRDKFVAAKHGKRGEVDELNGNTCKPLRGHYVCASNPGMFAELGTGSLRGKPQLAGGRGDLELYAPQLPLFAGTAGDTAVVAELTRGAIALRGTWTGTPAGGLGKLIGVLAPHVAVDGASGFAAGNVTALLAGLPPFPLAGGVTIDQLAKSLTGPVSVVIPAGSMDLQIHVPLTDPGPAQTAVGEHCKDLGQLLDLVAAQPKDACRFQLQASSALELEMWVDPATRELRVGAHRDHPAHGGSDALTPFGRELAAGDWTAVFWGRGSLLNLTGITPATVPPPSDAAAAIHAIALVDELGAGIRIERSGVTFRGLLRTAWTNPPELAAKLVAIAGEDIANGKATAQGATLASTAPGSPFAADFAAGQGGLVIPAALLGLAAAIVVPALESVLGAASGDDDGGDGDGDAPPPSP